MVFTDLQTSKVTAMLTGTTNTITIDGITSGTITPDNAQSQINKILAIVGKSVVKTKMKQIITREAAES